jgi:L-seryl-tRNA(Ser) seleniumtransferase
MIFASPEDVRARAERVKTRLRDFGAEVRESESAIGGGSTPDQTLPTWIIEVTVDKPDAFENRLRSAAVPVIARIERDKVIFDMRTVADDEEEDLVSAIHQAAG